jgi:hypothetical protein
VHEWAAYKQITFWKEKNFCQNFVLKFVGVAKTDGPAFNDG